MLKEFVFGSSPSLVGQSRSCFSALTCSFKEKVFEIKQMYNKILKWHKNVFMIQLNKCTYLKCVTGIEGERF